MGDVEVWDPSFPHPSQVAHPKNAIQAIRDLVMQVRLFTKFRNLLQIRAIFYFTALSSSLNLI